MELASIVLTSAHVLAGAAWFGSMFYSLTVLHPRAQRYFETPDEFEHFITTVSDGSRSKVLGAFGFIAITGLALLLLSVPRTISYLWLTLIGFKIILFFVALVVFWYTSWRLWPARIFATPDEIPTFQRRFRTISRTMIALVGLNFVLGIVAHAI